jgi:anthranilate phosphoribosyltransferase
MKEILEYLYQHKTFSYEEAKAILLHIASGKFNDCQIASFLTAFIMRNITPDELMGFRDGLLELCKPLDVSSYNPMDVCGTGGDAKNTFNISTLTAFVVAGAGIPVVKHGNYGVSSVSGSSTVLEQCGIRFETDENRLKEQLDKAGICFLHAPLFHPAMKAVAPVRRALGVRTFFNMLGPLVNPAKPKIQLCGVFSLELARIYQHIFDQESMKYCIVHSTDGYDEISLTSFCKIITPEGVKFLSPEQLGFDRINKEDLYGGATAEEAASLFMKILQGKGNNSQNNVVLVNAAMAIQTYKDIPFSIALEIAQESLFELKAYQCFNLLKQLS